MRRMHADAHSANIKFLENLQKKCAPLSQEDNNTNSHKKDGGGDESANTKIVSEHNQAIGESKPAEI